MVSVELAIQFDWTSTGIHTLAPKTLDALEKIKQGDREIKAIYFEIPTQGHLAKSAFFANQRVEDMLRAYQIRAGTKFKVQLVDMYREPLLVKEYNGAPGTTVFERIAPTPNESLPRRQSVTVSEVMHKSSTPRGQPLFKGEQAFTTALARLMDERERTICFLTGHEESPLDSPAPNGLTRLRAQMKRENYKAKAIDLLSKITPTRETSVVVPKECQAVVLAGPQQPFTDSEIDALYAYFEGGGGLVILVDPFVNHNAALLTRKLGVDIIPGPVFDTVAVQSGFQPVPALKVHKITNDLRRAGSRAVLRQAVPLVKLASAKLPVTTLLESSSKSKAFVDGIADPVGPFALAVAVGASGLRQPGQGRAVIFGDSDIMQNEWIVKGAAHADLILNSIHWSAGYEDRITITPKDPDMRLLELTSREGLLVLATTGGLIPLCIALLGGFIWRRRRNRV